MSLKFPYSGFYESSGNSAALFQERVRDGIVSFACGIWGSFPNFVVKGRNPASSFARGYMNQVCSVVQPPVPYPDPPFQGGQCEVLYGVNYSRAVIVNGQLDSWQTGFTTTANAPLGPIQAVSLSAGGVVQPSLEHWGFNGNGNASPTNGVNRLYVLNVTQADGQIKPMINSTTSGIRFDGFFRIDNQPDNCGNPPVSYPENPPSSQDLTGNINIVNLDGVDNTYEITYNQISNEYNFPMGFKFNGVNVVLDLSGLTFYGDPNYTSPNAPNSNAPPGSDGGKTGTGQDYVKPFPDQDYPVVPDFSVPETINELIEWVVCESGIISIIAETIKIPPGISPIWKIAIDLLVNLLEEVCESVETGDVGFPEYYPVLPGTQRPAVVLYYKEVINGVKQRSTYTSTITHPSASLLANFDSILIPDKVMGQTVVSATLTDGSRIRASGNGSAVADGNFQFLLSQVDSSFVPSDIQSKKVSSFYDSLQIKTVVCSQMEYYPNGKASGVSPERLRIISVG